MINIWKIDYSAVHDGPGMRTAIFLKGCNLRCLWCSNPEGQTMNPNLIYRELRCIRCGICVGKCPNQALELRMDPEAGKPKIHVDQGKCRVCGQCASACPAKALEIWGKTYTVSELMKIIEKNRFMYQKTGGGVTLTGGDPLYQAAGVLELLKQCGRKGIHTVIETSACGDEEDFAKILEEVDWVFLDLKHIDPAEHLRLTGQPNDLIIRNLRRASSVLGRRNRDLVVRLVVIPGINDGENIRRAAELLASLPYLKGVEFLPYHNYALSKYEDLHRKYKLTELQTPTAETLENCKQVMRSRGISVIER